MHRFVQISAMPCTDKAERWVFRPSECRTLKAFLHLFGPVLLTNAAFGATYGLTSVLTRIILGPNYYLVKRVLRCP